jgi:hypothetical protein
MGQKFGYNTIGNWLRQNGNPYKTIKLYTQQLNLLTTIEDYTNFLISVLKRMELKRKF